MTTGKKRGRPFGSRNPARPSVVPPARGDKLRRKGEGRLGVPTAVEEVAMFELERAVGGRDALIAALVHAPPSDDLRVLHAFLADPRNRLVHIQKLCDKAHISLPVFWSLFKEGRFARAQVEAIARVTERLPGVAADVMMRALPHRVPCPACHGLLDPKRRKCRTCQGQGQIPAQPALATQELALEMGGVIKRGGGDRGVHLQVTQQQALMGSQMPTAFARFQMATDRLLYGDGRPTAPTGSSAVTELTEEPAPELPPEESA
jgi:hypothetical protein